MCAQVNMQGVALIAGITEQDSLNLAGFALDKYYYIFHGIKCRPTPFMLLLRIYFNVKPDDISGNITLTQYLLSVTSK
jgi:GDP-D-mannose dehydratase